MARLSAFLSMLICSTLIRCHTYIRIYFETILGTTLRESLSKLYIESIDIFYLAHSTNDYFHILCVLVRKDENLMLFNKSDT